MVQVNLWLFDILITAIETILRQQYKGASLAMDKRFIILLISLALITGQPGSSYGSLSEGPSDDPSQTLKGHIEYQTPAELELEEEPFLSQEAQPEITELNFDQYINMEAKKIELDSHYLSGRFSAYEVNLTNNTPFDLQIIQATIINGYDGHTAYEMVKEDPLSIRRIRLSFSYTGIATSAIKRAHRVIRNKTASKESVLFTNTIPKDVFETKETLAFNALVPAGEKPKLFIKYYEPETKKIYYSHLF